MAGSKRVFLGCWVSLDEQDRLCEVSLDSSTIEEVSGPSDQQIDSIFQAFRHHRVEIRREGDASSNPILILDDDPSVAITPDVNTPPQTYAWSYAPATVRLKSGALDIYTIRSQVAEYLKEFADEMTVWV